MSFIWFIYFNYFVWIDWSKVQLGDLATWIGSIGIVGTLTFTLRELHIDRQERKEDKLRLQAKVFLHG